MNYKNTVFVNGSVHAVAEDFVICVLEAYPTKIASKNQFHAANLCFDD